MKIEKAHWNTDGDSVRITMPLNKVDEEKRIVSGFATLDNEDLHGDIVLASASKAAFERFRGNIRLMHQPIPAGKLVNFREEEYYNTETQKFHRGIYVDVYVSKGAPDVWEMVLDGTLTGFSIGGSVVDQESQFVKDAGKVIRFIKDYEMIELSLVDNPANQLSNIFSIQKTADGAQFVKGMIAEVESNNVFYCAKDEIASVTSDEAKGCNVCGHEMKNIGWFESDGGDKTEKVNALVLEFTKNNESVEGRENNMPENDEVKAEEVDTETKEEETDAPAENEEDAEVSTTGTGESVLENVDEVAPNPEDGEVVENPLAPETEAEDKEDIAKMFAEFSDTLQKALTTNAEATAAELEKVNSKLEAVETVSAALTELSVKHTHLEKRLDDINSELTNVEKRFDSVEKGVGIKKSGDLGGSKEGEKLEKSASKPLWGGRFLGSVDSI